jgi:hypothetical protein
MVVEEPAHRPQPAAGLVVAMVVAQAVARRRVAGMVEDTMEEDTMEVALPREVITGLTPAV